MPAPPRRPLSRRRAASSRQTDRPTDSSSSSLYAAMITIMRKPRARSLHGVRCCVRMGRLTDERREDGRRARAVPPRHPQVEPRPNSAVQGMRLCDGRRAVRRRACKSLTQPLPLPLPPPRPARREPSLPPVLTANDVSSPIFQGLQVQFSDGNREGKRGGGASGRWACYVRAEKME